MLVVQIQRRLLASDYLLEPVYLLLPLSYYLAEPLLVWSHLVDRLNHFDVVQPLHVNKRLLKTHVLDLQLVVLLQQPLQLDFRASEPVALFHEGVGVELCDIDVGLLLVSDQLVVGAFVLEVLLGQVLVLSLQLDQLLGGDIDVEQGSVGVYRVASDMALHGSQKAVVYSPDGELLFDYVRGLGIDSVSKIDNLAPSFALALSHKLLLQPLRLLLQLHHPVVEVALHSVHLLLHVPHQLVLYSAHLELVGLRRGSSGLGKHVLPEGFVLFAQGLEF